MLADHPEATQQSKPGAEPPDDVASTEPGLFPEPASSSVSRARQRLALASLALALGAIGQLYWARSGYLTDGLVFSLAGVGVFLLLVGSQEGTRWPRSKLAKSIGAAPLRTVLLTVALGTGLLVTRLLKTQPTSSSYWGIFALWALSILSYCLAVACRPTIDLGGFVRRYRTDIVVVGALTMIAATLRFVRLGTIPDTLYVDEGEIGLLARSVLDGQLKNMFATAYGHSTLYLFIMAGILKVFGINATALRLSSAVAGTLTVPVVYVLARSLFNRRVAVVAAALLAVSHIHVHFSRLIIAGGIQDALFATLAFYLFVSGLERRSRNRLLLSALTVGMHVYLYMGGRLLVLLLPIFVLALLILEPETVRANARNLLAFIGALLVVLAPMAVWALTHTAEFMSRVNQMGIVQTGWLANEAKRLQESQLRVLATAVYQTFLTVVHYPAEAFYGSRLPMLDIVAATFFLFGLGYSLYRLGRRQHLLLNAWLWAGIVAGGALVLFPTLAAYRIILIVPALCVFVGLGWDRLVDSGIGFGRDPEFLKGALTVAFIGLLAVLNLNSYFGDYVSSCRYGTWEMRFAWRMAESIKNAGMDHQAYLLAYPRIQYEPRVYPSVGFLLGQRPLVDIRGPLADELGLTRRGGKAVFFLVPERENELPLLLEKFPGGVTQRIDDCGKPLMIIYRVDEEKL